MPRHPATLLRRILALLAKHQLYPRQAIITSSSAAATEMARECVRQQYDLVIAAGGDGTINAVVNGLACSRTALAVLPLGTINIFGLQINLPLDIERACAIIAGGRIHTMDLGMVNRRYFACMAGIGFDAFVIKATDPHLKRIFGVIALAFSAFVGFFIYPFTHLRLRIDQEKHVRKGYFVIVGNMKYYGGGLLLLPHANTSDGYLDVCLFKRRGFFTFVRYLWGWRRGLLEKYLDVEYFQCKKLVVQNRRQYVHLDGEYLGRERIRLKIVPAALRIVVP
ncbi:diacylglycerol kinase family lipid kinase [candidate division FCPU426 bacterium]|nr:diacylglycerol kinase family lipid kinase [candidate division FCPU426 bacterium]